MFAAEAFGDLISSIRNWADSSKFGKACEKLHREATLEDVPRLMTLLKDEDALVREAAAWPVSELVGTPAPRDLLNSYQLQRLKLPPSLYKCPATTNLIESPQSGVARRTANVKYWRGQGMVEHWFASALLLTENRFRKISGHRDLWALATIPGRKTETEISRRRWCNMKVPSSVFQLLHGISSALDNHSIRCFTKTGINFPITEV